MIQDADLEYDLADYEKLLDPIRRLEASFVLGSRHPVGANDWQIRHFSDNRGISDILNGGHLIFTWFLNSIFRQNTRDPFTMFKVFRRDCINNLKFECNRFDFDLELFGKLIRNGFRPLEIGVHYNSRLIRRGKEGVNDCRSAEIDSGGQLYTASPNYISGPRDADAESSTIEPDCIRRQARSVRRGPSPSDLQGRTGCSNRGAGSSRISDYLARRFCSCLSSRVLAVGPLISSLHQGKFASANFHFCAFG